MRLEMGEYERGAGDVADLGWAGGDVLQVRQRLCVPGISSAALTSRVAHAACTAPKCRDWF